MNIEIENIFYKENIVFGTVPIGYPGDISINMIRHLNHADIILTETLFHYYSLLLSVNQFSQLFGPSFELKPKAEIYTYVPDDSEDYINSINEKIIEEASNNKKVLVISEEGYSNFVDPAATLKEKLIDKNIPFYTLHGPSAIIATVASSDKSPQNFIYAGDVAWFDEKKALKYLGLLELTKMSIVFTFNTSKIPYSIELIQKVFPTYSADFCINISRPDEKHIRGNISDILTYIQNNIHMFETNSLIDRYTLIIDPITRNKKN